MDLTRYAGLTFWVRGSVARSAAVSVVLNDGTGSIADGGSFSGLPSLAFTPTGAWQRVSFPFAGLGSITGVVSLDFVILDGVNHSTFGSTTWRSTAAVSASSSACTGAPSR